MFDVIQTFPFEWIVAFLLFVTIFANLKHNWLWFLTLTAIVSLVL